MYRYLMVVCCCAHLFMHTPVISQTVTDAEVSQAISLLKQKIYEEQEENGLWVDGWDNDDSNHGIQWGGTTALATYALLQAGESFQHPALQKPIQFLRNTELNGVYAVALRAQMWGILPDEFNSYMAKDVNWLISAQRPGPKGGVVFSYDLPTKTKSKKTKRGVNYSNSRTKFGLLGLWEGAKRGHKVPSQLWKEVEEHYINTQNDDGGWQYRLGSNEHSRGSMTAAGLIALHAIEDYHHRNDFKTPGVKLPIQKSIDKGLNWFEKNFRPDIVPEVGGSKGGYSNLFYYLYAMERVGLASGVKYFNGKPWFESGARVIIEQLKKGDLNPGRRMNSKFHLASKSNNIISMSFALIFLARGSNPVLVNKLELPDVAWNNRPSDMTQLTKWMSDNMETPVIWQRIPISTNSNSWQDAPILYLASHQAVKMTDEQKDKLKRYINAGGILITSSDNRSETFGDSVKKTMSEIYPDYAYQPMTVRDPVFSAIHQFDKLPTDIEVLHNGVRHLAIHFPEDLSWTFHTEDRRNIDIWKMFVNVVYYATGGWPRSRRTQLLQVANQRGPEIHVGRLNYEGNDDPEPGAWPKFNRLMGEKMKAKLSFLSFDDLTKTNVRFVHMTGTDTFKITELQMNAMIKYAENGGTLLIESASGDPQFTTGLMEAIQAYKKDSGIFPIEAFSPTVTGEGFGGYDVSIARYRKFSVVLMGRTSKRVRLQEMIFDGGGRILFSEEDMTSGLLGAPAWGINGYSPDTARKLMVNLVLSSQVENVNLEESVDNDTADIKKQAIAEVKAEDTDAPKAKKKKRKKAKGKNEKKM